MSAATEYKIEYLITSSISDAICSNLERFNHLLKTIDGVEISSGLLNYSSKSFKFEANMGELSDKQKIYFDVVISTHNESSIDSLIDLNRKIRMLLSKFASSPVQVLWDDVSHYYASKAYPKINQIENLMRKLITKFMIINVGLGWHDKAVPKEVEQSIRINQKSHDYLQDVDFIQLSNFIFKEYASGNEKTLINSIRKASNLSDLSLDEIKSIVPRSNWERYFSPIIECEADFLRLRWEKLYDLRCKVAHNKIFSKSDFNDLQRLIDEITPHILSSLEKLSEVEVGEENKEEVAEIAISNTDISSSNFLEEWNLLHSGIMDSLLKASDPSEHQHLKNMRNNTRFLINQCTDKGFITVEMRNKIKSLTVLKNAILHSTGITIDNAELSEIISFMNMTRAYINEKVDKYTVDAEIRGAATELIKPFTEYMKPSNPES